ncbi:6,7-dimethyl-8-ribityllumazine synthase [Patescibacteria group bacterium]|nr:6,7-dimethyl-8-ribityllumazine synthase [Patescibacteria group bacterium]MBU1673860.1 6,7-dimethyl-8-ribityllumazine synthase [Patescibacteria group bacterium]MBU1963237.1 6,7-dimethyl-8-ribityllumazine synthase [Patescibacteria group bacterium]
MAKIAIIKSTFNEEIVDKMIVEIEKLGFEFDIIIVPGAYEIPIALAEKADSYDYMACVGCLIKGETKHFDVIADSIAKQILEISIDKKTPIGFGVITALNRAQAEKRTHLGKQAILAAKLTWEELYGKNN